MDVFGTALATTTLLVQYVDACASFSSEAESLKVAFKWDLRAIEVIRDRFEQMAQSHQEHPQDNALLLETTKYLDRVVSKAQLKLAALQRKGRLRQANLGATWVFRRMELKELEAEMFAWTQRFGTHVRDFDLGKPLQVQADSGTPRPPIVRSNDRLREFAHLTTQEQKARARGMILRDPSHIASMITDSPWISTTPLHLHMRDFDCGELRNRDIILASRIVTQSIIQNHKELKRLESDMGTLAAALNCLDLESDVRLLKVESYFYHQTSGQFLFVHHSPYPVKSMTTLGKHLKSDAFPEIRTPMDQRLNLAHKLAEAVLFLHTAGFLHKSITSHCVVIFRKLNSRLGTVSLLDNAYLMGYNLIRGAEARTTKEGAVKDTGDSRSIWDFDIYQHPDRQHGMQSAKYTKAYDVYSLGVVLLEIGAWQPLEVVGESLEDEAPSAWARGLSEIAKETLGPRVGSKYSQVVSWCLALDGNDGMKETDFIENVLDPLEEMATALSLPFSGEATLQCL